MPGEYPVIKFSPFEALLIGEKNKIAKRKPMKNTIFVTRLNNQKKTFDLRTLFDVKDDECENNDPKKKRKGCKFVMNKHKVKYVKNGDKIKCKSKPTTEVYCFEYEGHKVIVKNNELAKVSTKNKNNQSNKVKFKRDFKFKETLEERIVHKIQKRRNLRTNLIKNRVLSQTEEKSWKGHCIRGKDGKFITKDEYEQIRNNGDITSPRKLSSYLKHLYIKKTSTVLQNEEKPKNGIRNQSSDSADEGQVKKKIKLTLDESHNLFNVSEQYYDNVITKEVIFPPLPDLKVTDFDNDSSLLDILCECQPHVKNVNKVDDFDLENCEIARRRLGLRMYERKKPVTTAISGSKEHFNNSLKENHYVNKNVIVNSVESVNEKKFSKGRRNGLNYLIDERPTNDNHLLSQNKFRSLFYKTACGTETYLGNIIKPVLLNSSFGRLPDIS